jgi:hypothetical protein
VTAFGRKQLSDFDDERLLPPRLSRGRHSALGDRPQADTAFVLLADQGSGKTMAGQLEYDPLRSERRIIASSSQAA